MTKVDGIKAKHVIIQPTCRTQGDEVALKKTLDIIGEAFREVAGYEANNNAKFHFVLTVDRSKK